LARSHDVLIRSRWEDAPLRDVVEGALAAYGGEPGRITVEGLPVLLPANLMVTVSLAFHELATNAVKHGALSVPGGSVDVAWAVVGPAGKGARRVEITWRERGGPPVKPPSRRGFGSQLLEQGIGSQAHGTVQLDFRPEGLECRISLPIGTGQ
jgi:two-component sensor histidine kinase